MQHKNSNSNAPLKLRLLLTSDCTARCGYCHNEGQAKDTTRLSLADITHVLDTLAAGNRQVSEIILSGGEPTLHPQLAEIARRSKATGALVSINTHGAHPGLLERLLSLEVEGFEDDLAVVAQQFGVAQDLAHSSNPPNGSTVTVSPAATRPRSRSRTM